MQPKTLSPLVFAIPLGAAALLVGFTILATGANTDIRGRASNDTQNACVKKCKLVAGNNKNKCDSACTEVIAGTMTCYEAKDEVSAGFVNVCWDYSPVGRACNAQCSGVGDSFSAGGGAAKGLCTNVCRSVLSGEQTCRQACDARMQGNLAKFKTQCMTKCQSFKLPNTPTPSSQSIPTPTGEGPTPTPGGAVNCSQVCSGNGGFSGVNAQKYRTECTNMCNEINAGTKTCPSACNKYSSNDYLKNLCMTKLCSSN